ncbi:MAG: hypothetical protein Q9M17_07305 [Mariprofundus sp.]|nr:hypothetical protein [Mariprofundus sp.]
MMNYIKRTIMAATMILVAALIVPGIARAGAEFTITNHQVEGNYNNTISMVVELSVTNTGPAPLETVQIHPVGCGGCGVYIDSLAVGQTANYMGDVVVPAALYNAADPGLGLNWQVSNLNGQ